MDVDGWWHPELTGHTPERYTSALLMAYWSGADRVYIEGGYGDESHWLQKECMDRYERFVKEYAPAHPRPYSWRDFQPDIAIVRSPALTRASSRPSTIPARCTVMCRPKTRIQSG